MFIYTKDTSKVAKKTSGEPAQRTTK